MKDIEKFILHFCLKLRDDECMWVPHSFFDFFFGKTWFDGNKSCASGLSPCCDFDINCCNFLIRDFEGSNASNRISHCVVDLFLPDDTLVSWNTQFVECFKLHLLWQQDGSILSTKWQEAFDLSYAFVLMRVEDVEIGHYSIVLLLVS